MILEIRKLNFNFEQEENNHLTGLIETGKMSHVLGREKKWREVIEPGVFARAIKNAFENQRDIDFISDHDDSKILASTKNNSFELHEDEAGLHISANVTPTSYGKDVLELVKSGIITGLSFGMTVNSQRWSKCEDGVDLRYIDDIDLFEVSAVRTPAYPLTNLENRGIDIIEDIEIPKEENDEEDIKEMDEIKEMLQKVIDMLSPQERVEDIEDEKRACKDKEKRELNEENNKEKDKEDIKTFLKETLFDIMKDLKKQDKVDDIKEDIQEEIVEDRKNEAGEIQKEVDEKVEEDKPNTDKQEKVIEGTTEEPVKEKVSKEKRSLNKEDLEDLKEFFK